MLCPAAAAWRQPCQPCYSISAVTATLRECRALSQPRQRLRQHGRRLAAAAGVVGCAAKRRHTHAPAARGLTCRGRPPRAATCLFACCATLCSTHAAALTAAAAVPAAASPSAGCGASSAAVCPCVPVAACGGWVGCQTAVQRYCTASVSSQRHGDGVPAAANSGYASHPHTAPATSVAACVSQARPPAGV
jgi:hypothetical protein